MQRHVNRSGIGVPERHFVRDAEHYADAIRDRSSAGRQRWVLYFVKALLDAMFEAWKDVERVRDHVEREPWLDARPLSEREQAVYDLVRAVEHWRGNTHLALTAIIVRTVEEGMRARGNHQE